MIGAPTQIGQRWPGLRPYRTRIRAAIRGELSGSDLGLFLDDGSILRYDLSTQTLSGPLMPRVGGPLASLAPHARKVCAAMPWGSDKQILFLNDNRFLEIDVRTSSVSGAKAWFFILGAYLLSGAASAQQGPFEPGARWTFAAPDVTPWIPESLAFCSGADLVLASGNHGNPRVQLFEARGVGDRPPRFVDLSVAGASVVLAVAAGSGPEDLFAVAQYPSPDLFQRRTEVTAYDATLAASPSTRSRVGR